MKLRAIVINTETHRIRFTKAIPGPDYTVGKIVTVPGKNPESAILHGPQALTRDMPGFPLDIAAGLMIAVFGASVGIYATAWFGPNIGYSMLGFFFIIGIAVVAAGLRRWQPTTYFLMREGDPRPLGSFSASQAAAAYEQLLKLKGVELNDDQKKKILDQATTAAEADAKDKPFTRGGPANIDVTLAPAPYDAGTFNSAHRFRADKLITDLGHARGKLDWKILVILLLGFLLLVSILAGAARVGVVK